MASNCEGEEEEKKNFGIINQKNVLSSFLLLLSFLSSSISASGPGPLLEFDGFDPETSDRAPMNSIIRTLHLSALLYIFHSSFRNEKGERAQIKRRVCIYTHVILGEAI